MTRKILISAGNVTAVAHLDDSIPARTIYDGAEVTVADDDE